MYVNDMLKINGIHLKCVFLVKQESNHQANLSPENLENTSNFEGCGSTLVAYKKVYSTFQQF